jgi:hypothetical protein
MTTGPIIVIHNSPRYVLSKSSTFSTTNFPPNPNTESSTKHFGYASSNALGNANMPINADFYGNVVVSSINTISNSEDDFSPDINISTYCPFSELPDYFETKQKIYKYKFL